MNIKITNLIAILAFCFAANANAAYLSINDNVGNGLVTVVGGDFENGLTFNGGSNLFTSFGTDQVNTTIDNSFNGNSPVNINASWIDTGASTAGSGNIFFGSNGTITDELSYTASTNGSSATIVLTLLTANFTDIGTSVLNNAGVAVSIPGVAFLSSSIQVTNIPATTPIPAAIWLFATGLVGMLGLGKKHRIV